MKSTPYFIFAFLLMGTLVFGAPHENPTNNADDGNQTNSSPARPDGERQPAEGNDTADLANEIKDANSAEGVQATMDKLLEGGKELYENLKSYASEKVKEYVAAYDEASNASPDELLKLAGFDSEKNELNGEPSLKAWVAQAMLQQKLIEGEGKIAPEVKAKIENMSAPQLAKAFAARQKIMGIYNQEGGNIVNKSEVARAAIQDKALNTAYRDYYGQLYNDASASYKEALNAFETNELPKLPGYQKYYGERGVELTGFNVDGTTFSVLKNSKLDYQRDVVEYNNLIKKPNPTAEDKAAIEAFRSNLQYYGFSVLNAKEGPLEFKGVTESGAFKFVSSSQDQYEKEKIALPRSMHDAFATELEGRKYVGYTWEAGADGKTSLARHEYYNFGDNALKQSGEKASPLGLIYDKTLNQWYLQSTLAGNNTGKVENLLDKNWTSYDFEAGITIPVDTRADLVGENGFVIGGEGHKGNERYHVVQTKNAKGETVYSLRQVMPVYGYGGAVGTVVAQGCARGA